MYAKQLEEENKASNDVVTANRQNPTCPQQHSATCVAPLCVLRRALHPWHPFVRRLPLHLVVHTRLGIPSRELGSKDLGAVAVVLARAAEPLVAGVAEGLAAPRRQRLDESPSCSSDNSARTTAPQKKKRKNVKNSNSNDNNNKEQEQEEEEEEGKKEKEEEKKEKTEKKKEKTEKKKQKENKKGKKK